jgi:hypothetical protein
VRLYKADLKVASRMIARVTIDCRYFCAGAIREEKARALSESLGTEGERKNEK